MLWRRWRVLIVVVLFLALFTGNFTWLRNGLYAARRDGQVQAARFAANGDQIRANSHFVLYYPRQDGNYASLVLAAAEKAYGKVTKDLGYAPPGKLTIVMYPTQAALEAAVGGLPDETVVGLYWDGIIRLPYPGTWIPEAWPESTKANYFFQNGPRAHELTHLILDYRTDGNYPAWFTEGLAQYEDKQITGYVWTSPQDGKKPYSYAQLDESFYALPDQALAYHQALSMVERMEKLQGPAGMRALIGQLAAGKSFPAAVNQVYKLTPEKLGMAG